MTTEGNYELRGLDLYLDGERLPVATTSVRAALLRQAVERRVLPIWDERGCAPIDRETVNEILKIERVSAITKLANLLKEAA